MTKSNQKIETASKETGSPITGWMVFAADAPMVGLEPHPGYAPQEDIVATNAEEWADVYGFHETLQVAKEEVEADAQAARDAVEEGHLEDAGMPDDIFPVSVSDDGTLIVYSPDDNASEMARYTADDIYDAFGMTRPTASDSPAP